ncbi:HlyD family efflux transporter periplasmic adaptor subunit [Naasia sp. SYSU D00948]|uniref:HlyD family efflux transporter periplasmic adaptor subunit n=1 Tax=Naasia sp. SYSU D00948 TaxID=2817379 RepID=UPI001B30CF19|nr:HlyD family efflux transporter periplasmic adaptor subunit [Naasia sp. SYSU D00948]
MTWRNRLKLFGGLVGVVALVAALTVLFNQRHHAATSTTAAIAAQEYPVGTDYGGSVVQTFVQQGDVVRAGDPLVSVRSLTLLQDLGEGLLSPSTVGYSVSEDGVTTFTSAVDGTVADMDAHDGAFVQPGAILATIHRSDSLYVSATFALSPTDYSRVEQGATVDLVLPNRARIAGEVSQVSVSTVDGVAEAELLVTSDGLIEGDLDNLVRAGTPVDATLHLRDDGPLAGVTDQVFAFARKIGL